jgi:hypothetical protein
MSSVMVQSMLVVRRSQINMATDQCQIRQIGQTPPMIVRNDMPCDGKDPILMPGPDMLASTEMPMAARPGAVNQEAGPYEY